MMCCEPIGIQRSQEACCGVSSCCECEPGSYFQRFNTRREQMECLEEYKSQLKRELEGMEEHLRELKLS